MLQTKAAELGAMIGRITPVSSPRMPLHHLIRQGVMAIAPELAARVLEEAPFVGQRRANLKHVAVFAETMRRDLWTPGSQIHFGQMEEDGSLHLLNGQHRLRAVILAQVPVQFQILISPAIDRRELQTLYWRHDRALRVRGAADVLDAAGIANQYGLKKQAAKAGYTAVGLIMCGFRRPEVMNDPFLTRSDEARLDAAEHYWPIVALYQDLVASAPTDIKRVLMTAGIAAVALMTLRHEPERAPEFWRSVAENDGLRRGQAQHTFLRDLGTRRLASAQDWAKVAASAWNAFYRDEAVTLLRITEGPPVILGTPYTAHRRRKALTEQG